MMWPFVTRLALDGELSSKWATPASDTTGMSPTGPKSVLLSMS